jgi:hypothetical protein
MNVNTKAKLWDKLINNCQIELVDTRDAEPIFEIKIPCSFEITDFKKAIQASEEGIY